MQSETISKLSLALSKVQGALNGAKKDSTNPYFKNKYADLESVWDACRTLLSDNGLSVVQTTAFENGEVILLTTLMHSSGEWIRSCMPLFLPKRDSQTLGSAMTYARRYSLAAIVGIVQTDDDGNKSSNRSETYEDSGKDETPRVHSPELLKPNEKQNLKDIIDSSPNIGKRIMEVYKVPDPLSISRKSYIEVITKLDGGKRANG